jgi:hypothetical protein
MWGRVGLNIHLLSILQLIGRDRGGRRREKERGEGERRRRGEKEGEVVPRQVE